MRRTLDTGPAWALALAGLLAAAAPTARAGDGGDLTALSLQELMAVEVYSASKFLQKDSDAPASVSVVTAADIRNYGYRSLADILRSVRGFYVTDDRQYQYAGVRGFNRPGDYNSRLLLAVDGYRLNDVIYDSASIGGEFFLDVDLIDRVEVVRGPGSSIYGSNAVFGVINVITRRGRDFNGGELAAAAASHASGHGRATWGRQLENGAELLLSATGAESRGQDHHYSEFEVPGISDGVARGLDGERIKRLYGKLAWGGYTATVAYSERVKAIPTASYDGAFNDPRAESTDSQAVVDLVYRGQAGEASDLAARVYYGGYFYHGVIPWDQPPITINRDDGLGEWWGAEAKLVTRVDRHKLVTGVEYQDNYRQEQKNADEDPPLVYLDDRHRSHRRALYVQDEVTLTEHLLLNGGLRYDHYSTVGGSLNPRLALIARPAEPTTLKFLYGTAFRAPNALELHYSSVGLGSKPAVDLMPEEVTSYEFVVEHRLRPGFRLTGAVYRNDIRNLISLVTDPVDGLDVYRNTGRVRAKGAEVEAERAWQDDSRLRASYAWQLTRDRDTGGGLENSPRHLAKLNYTRPLLGEALRAGVEVQYLSRRRTLAGGHTGGHAVANLTLLAPRLARNLELSASLYNLLDKRYADPGRPEHLQDAIAQDGRSFRLKLSYRF